MDALMKDQVIYLELRLAECTARPELHHHQIAAYRHHIAIARKVGGLNKLLQARSQLSNLLTYMDGRDGAEALIAKAINDPTLLQALSGAASPDAGGGEAAPAEGGDDSGGDAPTEDSTDG